ncbi:MAG: DUF6142 family protein [Lachnospiraceae bacterium]
MKKEKNSLHFQGRTASKRGRVSVVIGVVAWLVFAALAAYSASFQGNAEGMVGIIGILDMLFAFVGAAFAANGFKERDVFYGMPVAGMSLNAILFLTYFVLYLTGMAI